MTRHHRIRAILETVGIALTFAAFLLLAILG